MKYNIISIGTHGRAKYINNIRSTVNICEEITLDSFNAMAGWTNVQEELDKRGLRVLPEANLKIGEVGVWISVFDRWQWCADVNEELLVFEDDAIPAPDFDQQFSFLHNELPDDYGFMTIWIPPNQLVDFTYNVHWKSDGEPMVLGTGLTGDWSQFNFGKERLALLYNGYGGVAQLYSPIGAQTLIDRVKYAGIYASVDCFWCLEAHAGYLDAYGPKPEYATLVGYDWPQTTIHNTNLYKTGKK